MEENTLKLRPFALYFDNCYMSTEEHEKVRKFLRKNLESYDPNLTFPYHKFMDRIVMQIEGINYFPSELQIHSLSADPDHISNHISDISPMDFINRITSSGLASYIGYFIAGRRCLRSQKFSTMVIEFRNSFYDLGYINFAFSHHNIRLVIDDRGKLYALGINYSLLPIFTPDVVINELKASSLKAQKQIIEICNILTNGGYK